MPLRTGSSLGRLTGHLLLVFSLVCLTAGPACAATGRVTKKAGLSGSFGYEVKSDGSDDPAYVQANFPSKQKSARISWLSKGKKLGFVDGAAAGTRVVIARAVTGTKIQRLRKVRWEVSLERTTGSSAPELTLRVYEQSGKVTDLPLGAANRKAAIEVLWISAKSSRSNDGEVTALRDGQVVARVTELDNKARLGAFAIGMLSEAGQIRKKKSLLIDRVWITHP